jgi:hypothetical protein
MLPNHGRYEYVPINRRPAFRWPNGAGLAFYVALNIEHYAIGEVWSRIWFRSAAHSSRSQPECPVCISAVVRPGADGQLRKRPVPQQPAPWASR